VPAERDARLLRNGSKRFAQSSDTRATVTPWGWRPRCTRGTGEYASVSV